MKYKIIEKNGASTKAVNWLEAEVNRIMVKRWQPLGGVSGNSIAIGHNSYTQAMIYRPAPKPPEIPE